jgi:hypothetical protein
LHGLNNAPWATKQEENEEDQGASLVLRKVKIKESINELTAYSFEDPTMERKPCSFVVVMVIGIVYVVLIALLLIIAIAVLAHPQCLERYNESRQEGLGFRIVELTRRWVTIARSSTCMKTIWFLVQVLKIVRILGSDFILI